MILQKCVPIPLGIIRSGFFLLPSKEGFDIVIGNPPYLESRSSNFSESLKVSLQSEIKKRRLSNAGAFPRGADLLIFFYELSLRLLNKKGYNVFITENSWLSTDYGKLFQNFLLKKCEVHAIIDSEYKYFETADINTIITIIRNRNENNDNLPVKFFHCDGSLEKYPCNTFAIHDTEKITLKSFLSSDQLLHNYKWGVIIRAEQKLLRIIEAISQLEDKSLASKISIGQGLNLTKNHIVYSQSSRTYPYYTSEIGPTYSWSNSSCYVSKDDISGREKTSWNQVCQRKNWLLADKSMSSKSMRMPCSSSSCFTMSAISFLNCAFLSCSGQA